jgi:hypothetical protein
MSVYRLASAGDSTTLVIGVIGFPDASYQKKFA